jgi:hypothetical protein
MTAFRRHLVALTGLILSVQILALALGTAQACWPGEHTHGGAAAPDCVMHHQSKADEPSGQHHSHGDHATPLEAAPASGATMTCRCSSDGAPIYLGQTATLHVPVAWSPVVQAGLFDAGSEPPVVDASFSPPSPPPR